MREPVIDVRGLRCRYGGFEAVRGLDFHVDRGELFALLGTNGAGKTTTMETIEGHRAPDAGQVRVLGADPARERARVRPHCGIMLQESGFAGDLTVLETVRLWQHMISRTSDADEALETLNLAHRRDVRVKQLSGGEKRRLDLVLATLGAPEVLFLDEPTTGLDPESRKDTWRVIQDLLAGGTTILLTTHYLEEAERLAHRLAIMHEGRIAVAGSLLDVLERERAEISFDVPDGLGADDELPAVHADIDHDRLRAGRVYLRTDDLQRDIGMVVRWAETNGWRLQRFRAHHASLDEVFHGVINRSGVDDEPANGTSADRASVDEVRPTGAPAGGTGDRVRGTV